VESLAAFRLARPLLLDLAGDIHPDRWAAAGVPAEAAARLAGCPRARASLSWRIGWLGPGWDVPAADPEGWTGWGAALSARPGAWALLPGARLWRAGRWLGAGRHRAEVIRLVRRGEVEAFRGAAGGDAHLFALRRAALVWRGTPLAGDPAGLPDGASPAERVLATAGLGLGCWLAALPAGLAARVRAKLPPSCEPQLAAAAAWPGGRRETWRAALGRTLALER